MDALGTRTTFRLSAALEWVIAALFLAATLSVTVMIIRELRGSPSAVSAAPSVQELPARPPAVPEQAVSVPVLALADGVQLHLGDTLPSVSARLGRAAEIGRQEVDKGRVGERLTRFYDAQGTRFILVFEPLEREGEPRIAAIFLQ
jgi:hypothetical protein